MENPIQLGYEPQIPRVGHSPFGIASMWLAVLNYLFIALAGPPLYLSPFQSLGNEKEVRVAMLAAILGILLAIRALQDSRRKITLPIRAIVLHIFAIPAAYVFLPFL